MPLRFAKDAMFRRRTDDAVHRHTGQRGLDVGADKIARTAHSALELLDDVGSARGADIPLAWDPAFSAPAAAIEVYPAASLAAHGIPNRNYKKPEACEARRAIAEALSSRIHIQFDVEQLATSDHALDAAICVLAAADFLHGGAEPPQDPEVASREGWIWVRRRG